MQLQISKNIFEDTPERKEMAVYALAKSLNVVIEKVPSSGMVRRINTTHIRPELGALEKQWYALFNFEKITKDLLAFIGIKAIRKSKIRYILDKRFFGEHILRVLKKSHQGLVFNSEGKPLSPEDLDKIEDFLAKTLKVPKKKVHDLVLKGFLAGAVKQAKHIPGKDAIVISLRSLPKTLRDAIKSLTLTEYQVRQLMLAQQLAVEYVTGITEAARRKLKEELIRGMMDGASNRELATRLFRNLDEGFLNRDMERVAITEANWTANSGFFSGMSEGTLVVGWSHPDACPLCKREVHGKIYKVTHKPPEDYSHLDPGSIEYEKAAKKWDTHIWAGKHNVGRSGAINKIVNGRYVPREHHERSKGAASMHPVCRCTWVQFYKDISYVDSKGNVQFVIPGDKKQEAERDAFIKRNPLLLKGVKINV